MILPFLNLRAALPGAMVLLLVAGTNSRAAIPPHIVLQNGRYLPLAAVVVQGENYVVKTAAPGFDPGVTIPVAEVDHVFGDKPAEINQAVALMLSGEPNDAVRLLDPILAQHKCTNKLPGNFWLEAARAAVVANALYRKAPACNDLVKEISEATPAQGLDPIGELAKALLLPEATKLSERIDALNLLIADTYPSDICAYASFFRAELLKKGKREPESLEAYLTVSCLYPSGGMVINGVSQLRAAEILTSMSRPDEALALIKSALRCVKGTTAEEPVNKLLQSLKK